MDGIGNAIQAAGNMFNSLKNQLGSGVQNVANNANYGFWHSPVGQGLVGAQNFLESSQSANIVPQFKPIAGNTPIAQMGNSVANIPGNIVNTLVGQGVLNPAMDIGRLIEADITGQQLPSYTSLKSAPVRLGYNVMGYNRTPQQMIGNVAGTALPPLTAYGGGKVFGLGSEAVGQAGQGLLKTVGQGALTGGVLGGAYGTAQGLSEGRNQSLVDQFKQAAVSGIGNAAFGAVTGGAMSGGGYLVGQIRNTVSSALQKLNPTADPLSIQQSSDTFIRDELGRFAKGKLPDANEPKYYGDLRSSLGLPLNPNRGGINFGAEVGGKDLLSFGDAKGIEPEAATQLQQDLPQIQANAQKWNDPTYFRNLLTGNDWNEYLDQNPNINNHGIHGNEGPIGPDVLRDFNGHFGFVPTDTTSIPLDDKQSNAVIDMPAEKQWTATNGDREPIIVKENTDKPGTFQVVDGHHAIPTARQIGLDKIPAIVLDKEGPKLADAYDAIKSGQQAPIYFKGGTPIAQQAPQIAEGGQGEQALTPQQLQQIVPDLTSPQGQAKVQQMLDKATGVQGELDARFRELDRQTEPLPWEGAKSSLGNTDVGAQLTNEPPPQENVNGGTAAINPAEVAKQARLARSGSIGAINFRAQTLAQQMNQVLRTPEDNLNIRLALESPEKLDEYAAKSDNPQAFKAIAQKYSDFTDYVAQQMKLSGNNNMNFINDYFTHIWDRSTPEKEQLFQDFMAENAKNFQSGFTKERIVKTIQEGLAKGLTLKNANASQDVIQYANSMGTQVGAQSFNQRINELRPGGAQPIGQTPYNYKGQLFRQSNVPGNQGTVIDPEIQKEMSYYNPSALADNPIVQTADKANRALKTWDLSFGGFHALKTTARAITEDPTIIPTAIQNAISPSARAAFNDQVIKDGVIDYGTKVGVTFSGPGDINPQGMIANIASKNPIEQANQSLFQGLINTYKVNSVRGMMDKFDLSNPTELKQAQDYGAQINNLYGGLNYEAIGRNKTVQQLLRFGVLASDFNEGKVRQIATAFNPTNFSPAANYARLRLFGEAAVFAVVAETGRALVTGKIDTNVGDLVKNAILNPSIPLPNNAMFNNNKKTQVANLPSSDIGDIYRAVTNPQQFLQARGAVLPRTVGQLQSGLDYYGRPLVPASQPDTLVNRAKALVPANLPIAGVQALKTAQGKETPFDAALNVLGLRVTNNPNDPTVVAQQQYFTGLKTAQDSLRSPNDQTLFNSLHPITKDAQGNPILDKTIYQKPWYYDTLLHNPKVMAAEAQFQQGQTNHDPLWDLSPAQRNLVMAAAVKLPGQKSTYSTTLQTQPWYQQFLSARNQWYTSLNIQQSLPVAGQMPYPQPSSQAQAAMNAKQWGNPQVQQYFQALDQYNNQQLQAMGLPPTAGQSTGTSSSSKSYVRSRIPIRASTSGKGKAVAPKASIAQTGLSLKANTKKMLGNTMKSIAMAKLKVPKVHFGGGTKGAVKGLSTKVQKPRQVKLQAFKMPALQKINLKNIGGGQHSPRYGKYAYQ